MAAETRDGVLLSHPPINPILLNAHKHHVGFLRDRIRQTVAAGPSAIPALAAELVVVGAKLMDLYHGPFSPTEIGENILVRLRTDGLLEPAAFLPWIEAGGGYRVIEFPEDTSQWVLRAGDDERYVHVHPARYSPYTIRVRANVLTTAVLALAHVGIHGSDPLDRSVVNRVRIDFLGLAPVGKDLSGEGGIGAVIELLR